MKWFSRFPKQLFWALLPAVFGILLTISPFGIMVEESLGLQSLFLMRGHRTPPSELSILSIDKASLDELNITGKVRDWPRTLYSEIIRQLNKQGAKLIVFTLALDVSRNEQNEQALADTMALADNVILPRYIKQIIITGSGKKNSVSTETIAQDSEQLDPQLQDSGEIIIVNSVDPPLPVLEESALASAVFPIPKDTEKVTRLWTFKQEISEPSTLPVVVFHYWALKNSYPAFLDLISGLDSSLAASLPLDAHDFHDKRNIHEFIDNLRWFFIQSPQLWDRARDLIESNQSWDIKTKQSLNSWINLYSERSTVYVNHYGPSATIPRWPLFNLLKQRSGAPFKDSVVFVGISENLFLEQGYGVPTVFSTPTARISIAEIAATATANLMADELVKPLSIIEQIALVLGWGVLIGMTAYSLSIPRAVLALLGLSVLYIIVANFLFDSTIWIPLVVPLLIMVPMALLISFGCRYRRNQKAQQAIHEAFSRYIPPNIVDKLANQTQFQDFREEGQDVYAVCLSTDAGQYTRLGEMIEPGQLAKLMNDYYEIMFEPVQRYNGFISDIVGDAMLALWTGAKTDRSLTANACQAVLTINNAVNQFNDMQKYSLPTRFGMHAGQIRLGNIGSSSRFEYRPVGDCVNTSNRIERLNKLLATHLLLTEDVVPDLDICYTRYVGSFLLEGKTNPLNIHELVGQTEQINEVQVEMFKLFDQAMTTYSKGDLQTAQQIFDIILQHMPDDGPSRFYYQRCSIYLADPANMENWSSTVSM
ncbi:MAG: CHASE2 domain-containing protein [Gammaproteobacteria bacterium]|nr:CHASE2 domain-containing protein [Gammaproteobacteria bacterium]